MMEGLNQNYEDYILAMRISASRDDSELWKERRAYPLQARKSNASQQRKSTTKGLMLMTVDHTTKVLASLVPDEIIYNVSDYSQRSYTACLLVGDVSVIITDLDKLLGFTDLCEMYNKPGNGGPSRLTQVLNTYIGSMVQEIFSHNGDVLKFSGDAFLAMWKASSSGYNMSDAVHSAVDSAIMIQKTLGVYETDVGVFLKVKLAISAGPVIFSIVGDSNMSHYVCAGKPILEVKKAEKCARPGEIIVSNSAWQYLNPNEFIWESYDAYHVKVKNITTHWRAGQYDTNIEQEDRLSQTNGYKIDEDNADGSTLLSEEKRYDDDFCVRPSVNYAAKMSLKEDLRKFIIPPIMRGIELDEPLEYLTEMRQIVIVFINVMVDPLLETVKYVELIDTAYKRVCSLAASMQGCVNKMSLFDKDLMFVLLFGLRGYKNEMESQMGLRCGAECFQAISNLKVVCVSVAVTTGMTYCGVVGHTLRREYTVISLSVNKAARFMVAYPGMVTCDRETFLHSGLEVRNFILQAPKPLKGITHVGPVYQFIEQDEAQGTSINPFPLLGHKAEINIYRRLLQECLKIRKDLSKIHLSGEMECNAVLIHGDHRVGKTRVLDEIVYTTSYTIPVNRFALIKKTGKVSYQTIRHMLSKPLGITESHSAENRKAILKLKLRKMKNHNFCCALNKVFHVNFERGTEYSSLTILEKMDVLKEILKYLCYQIFSEFWLIAIDNGEYVDDESWDLISMVLKLKVAFLVIVMSKHAQLSQEASNTFNNNRIEVIKIEPIDNIYQAALACQMLDVKAIPPELEKLIQSKSGGNPGWIENFLVSLVQAGGLKIVHMRKSELIEQGLVKPPRHMLERLAPEDKTRNEKNTRCNSCGSFHNILEKEDSWSIYKSTYKESNETLRLEKERENVDSDSYLSVCIIVADFKLDEIVSEFPMNAMIVKLFDSLTAYEQLLLKCSSVLGEFFSRAIQKLYELQVLVCAHGDFTHGDICTIFAHRFRNPECQLHVKCYCRGITIDDTCLTLPKYASCGYLRFRQCTFRDTTYNLLPDNQKAQFHTRAVRYLEKETKRCTSCGNNSFVKLLGRRIDQGFIQKCGPNQKHVKISFELKKASNEATQLRSSSQINLKVGAEKARLLANSFGTSPSSEFIPNKNCCGVTPLNNMRNNKLLTRTFSYADFSSCQCPVILNSMYTQMLEHCKGAGKFQRLMDAMLEYSYICIVSYNVPQAMKILDNALLELEANKNYVNQGEKWKVTLKRAKIETLLGYAFYELGQLEEAYERFEQALNYYGFTFPKSRRKIKLKIFMNELKQRLGLYMCNNVFNKTVYGYEAEFYNNVSECLSFMCLLFKDLQLWEHAELAAAWGLNKSIASDSDFYGLCIAYTNMLDVSHHFGRDCLSIALEVNGLYLCHRKRSSIEAQELKAVAQLYGAIFASRLNRSEMERSIHIGFILMQICSTVHAVETSLKVLPLIVHALLIRKKFSEAVTMILQLDYYADEDSDNSGKTWFFALCVTFHLETGYTIVPYEDCKNFCRIKGDNLFSMRDPDAERRYYTVMWLWSIRNAEWEGAVVWYSKLSKFEKIHSRDSLNNIITGLYLLEGLLIYVGENRNKRNVENAAAASHELQMIVQTLESASRNVKLIQPRFKHLFSYYKLTEEVSASYSLDKAKTLAEKNGNLLELAWIEHSEKAWSNNLSTIPLYFWNDHCQSDNLMNYHEMALNNYKLGCYTLPVPKYY